MIIGISGKIQSGKDTAAQIISSVLLDDVPPSYEGNYKMIKYIDPFKNVKFADKIKQIVCSLIGCDRSQLENEYFKNKELGDEWQLKDRKNKLTPRKILQLLGTECGRDIIHPNIWVNALFSNYIKKKRNYLNDSITLREYKDGRIVKESLKPLREADLYPNWIITDVRFPNEVKAIRERDGYLIRINRSQSSQENHFSETALDDYDDWDAEIDNNGTLYDLKKQIIKKIIVNEDFQRRFSS